MKDERFPLGVPVNRPKPTAHKPEREEVKRGVFSVGGKLQTELPILGPRRAPIPVPETTEGDDEHDIVLLPISIAGRGGSWPFPKSPKGMP